MYIYLMYTYIYIQYIYIYIYICIYIYAFFDVNKERTIINESLNIKKVKYFFSKKLVKQTLFLFRLPHLNINKHKMKQNESIKCLAMLLDENVLWKGHLRIIENKFTSFEETLK